MHDLFDQDSFSRRIEKPALPDLPAEVYSLPGADNLINPRNECGFPGITEFHCRAILGCCWDNNDYGFIASSSIPQCYQLPTENEAKLPSTPKNQIPKAYQPVIGTCNTNYYQIPQLFDDRRPCYYTPEEAASRGVGPLETPNEVDCLTILGCCWEGRPNIIEKYPHASQCYSKHEGDGKNLQFDLAGLAAAANGFFME